MRKFAGQSVLNQEITDTKDEQAAMKERSIIF